jgi:hypothetical protein
MDNKSWKAVVIGWTHPTISHEDGNTRLKPGEDWTEAEDTEALGNSKALSAIFNGIDKNIFRLFNTCTVAKKA